MKKLLVCMNVVLSGIVLFLACGNSGNKEPGMQKEQVVTNTIDTGCNKPVCFTYDPGNGSRIGQIDYNLAKAMAEDYWDDMGKKFIYDNDRSLKIEDANSVVFELETLKNYIAYIETGLCKGGCQKNNGIRYGIRFYYAKYPKLEDMRGKYQASLGRLPAEFAKRHTLFGVPVQRSFFEGRNSEYRIFDPMKTGQGCVFHFGGTTISGQLNLLEGDGDAQNHGSLRPPPAGAGTFPEQ